MKLTVRLFGDLRRYLPRGQEQLQLDLPEGATPMAVLQHVGIHPGEVWVVRANKQVVPDDHPLRDGDDLEIFEPVGGGALMVDLVHVRGQRRPAQGGIHRL